MNNLTILILCTAFACLAIGLLLLLQKSNSAKQVSWLLIALFPALIIFSFFPQSSITGTLLGFSVGGAVALFVLVWWYGGKNAAKAITTDEMNDKIRGLQDNLQKCQESNAKLAGPSVLTETKSFSYPLKKNKHKKIVLITGNIQNVKWADIWVNSENTNMQMSRYYEGTVSGIIRYLGARKDFAGEVEANGDLIATELAALMGSKTSVEPTTVIPTSPGELSHSHNVKKIFHVAAVRGLVGSGYRAVENIELCITKALDRAHQSDITALGCKSILFPLLGAGTAKGTLPDLAKKLILSAIQHLEAANSSDIESVYFLTWTDLELETCQAVLTATGRVVVSP